MNTLSTRQIRNAVIIAAAQVINVTSGIPITLDMDPVLRHEATREFNDWLENELEDAWIAGYNAAYDSMYT